MTTTTTTQYFHWSPCAGQAISHEYIRGIRDASNATLGTGSNQAIEYRTRGITFRRGASMLMRRCDLCGAPIRIGATVLTVTIGDAPGPHETKQTGPRIVDDGTPDDGVKGRELSAESKATEAFNDHYRRH